MTVYAGQGDPARTMELLWGQAGPAPPPGGSRKAPGPRRALSLEEIVAAAIAAADEDPAAGVSLRVVAARLGCTAMALYTYVHGKAELLDLMYDRAHAEVPARAGPHPDWRAAAEAWAGDMRAFYLRHPWVLGVSYARPVLGPGEQAVLETLAGILFATGLPAATVRGAVSALFHFTRGNAQTAAEARAAAAATGTADEQWWASRLAPFQRLVPDFAERYPMSARLAAAGQASARAAAASSYLERQAEEAFGAGLALLLDGVDAARAGL